MAHLNSKDLETHPEMAAKIAAKLGTDPDSLLDELRGGCAKQPPPPSARIGAHVNTTGPAAVSREPRATSGKHLFRRTRGSSPLRGSLVFVGCLVLCSLLFIPLAMSMGLFGHPKAASSPVSSAAPIVSHPQVATIPKPIPTAQPDPASASPRTWIPPSPAAIPIAPASGSATPATDSTPSSSQPSVSSPSTSSSPASSLPQAATTPAIIPPLPLFVPTPNCQSHITLLTLFASAPTQCTVNMVDGVHKFQGRDYAEAYAKAEDFIRGCPQPLTGTLTLFANRIAPHISLGGPSGITELEGAIVDTGANKTSLPDDVLRNLGYTPFATTMVSGVVGGVSAVAHLYHVPGDAFTVMDNGASVPLSTGTITVSGVVGGSMELIGPELFRNGATVMLTDRNWTVTPACP